VDASPVSPASSRQEHDELFDKMQAFYIERVKGDAADQAVLKRMKVEIESHSEWGPSKRAKHNDESH
jgi:hypothetical protein